MLCPFVFLFAHYSIRCGNQRRNEFFLPGKYLVYNTVVRLCHFFFGGKANLVQIFLLNPNFLLVHRNSYSEGMDTNKKLHVDTLIFIPT
jgi:hypothetical protein